MHFCRICRTEKNLKYTKNELLQLCQKQRSDVHKTLLHSTPTSGNICLDCDTMVAIADQDSDCDLDCNGVGRQDTPIIVDDDELLYNMFFKKIEEQRRLKRKQTAKWQFDRPRKLTHHSLGSDGDTEIIEVLTSRESTPAPLDNISNGHRIVAVIDLETEPDRPQEFPHQSSKGNAHNADMQQQSKSGNIKKKRRKCYAEREMRLVASLDLISSDSELEETIIENSTKTLEANTVTSSPQKCKHCDIRLPDVESLQVHERIHFGISCPACQLCFTSSPRLVHHMRCKHRAYEGDVLEERARCPQDSAMTIRLRYMQRYMFYECQLCGHIDAIFKDHREHVIKLHADESKSLHDPMMKAMNCPICKKKCGTQYIHLCKHIIKTHTPTEYKPHLSEVTNERTFGFKTGLKNVGRSARVFQLTKRRNFFFECKQCRKVVAGYMNHVAHMNSHYLNNVKEQKKKKIKDKALSDTEIKNKNLDNKNEEKTKLGGNAHDSEIPNQSSTNGKANAAVITKTHNLRKKRVEKVVEDMVKEPIQQNSPKETLGQNPGKELLKQTKHNLRKKKSEPLLDTLLEKHVDSSMGKKPKSPSLVENGGKAKILSDKTKISQKVVEALKSRKLPKLTKKSAFPKGKLRPTLRKLPTQKYRCKHCELVLKGFARYNLHQLSAHSSAEYHRCNACNKAFKNQTTLVQHQELHTTMTMPQRNKRKRKHIDSCDSLDENCNKSCKRSMRIDMKMTRASTMANAKQTQPSNKSTATKWLQDLLQMNRDRSKYENKNDSSNNTATNATTSKENELPAINLIAHQCLYCAALFAAAGKLVAHEQEHINHKERQIIKRLPLTSATP